MSKDEWIILLLVVSITCFVFAVVYADKVGDMKVEVAKAESYRQAIGKIYDQSLSVRISLDIGMPEVAKQLWYEKLQPAMEEALELCVEYKGTKRTKDMASYRLSTED